MSGFFGGLFSQYTASGATGGSILLNGTSQYLTANAAQSPPTLGTSLFTIEAFVRFTALPANGSFANICSQGNGTDFRFFLNGNATAGQGALTGWQGASTKWTSVASGIVINTWYHVCIMRSSSTVVDIYVNGVKLAKSVDTTTVVTYTATGMYVAGESANYRLNGLMTNYRCVIGTAVYNVSGFTPPTAPLTNITNTKLLLLASTAGTFTDDSSTANSGAPYTVTNVGGATYSAASPFSSLISVDYLVVGGGGAGGGWQGGGGGAGGLLTSTALALSPSTPYTVTVGAGGLATTYTGAGDTRGANGAASVLSTLSAAGGGYGGAYGGGTAAWANPNSGGSGGGGGFASPAPAGGAGNTPTTTPSQGNSGGAGNASAFNEGGGGGAGQPGGIPTIAAAGYAGSGGNGVLVTGFATTFAGTGDITTGSTTLTATAVSAGSIKIGTQITGAGIRTAQSITITSISAASNLVTINYATQGSAPFSVGQVITVAGVTTTTAYNNIWIVTACTTTATTVASSVTGTATVTGATVSSPAAYIAGQLTATNAATVTATFTQATSGSRTIVLSSYTVGSAAAIAVGQFVQPITGIPAGTYVIAVNTGTNTITISNPTTAAIAASASLYTAGQAGTYTLSSQATATTTGVALTSSGTYYAGGGGGGPDAAANTYGGAGGGGKGNKNALAFSGAFNTGGGGGGAYGATAGSGGAGVVIIKIPASNTATFSSGVTSTLDSSVSGFKIYTVQATATTSETVTLT